jgi:hypothetical protein
MTTTATTTATVISLSDYKAEVRSYFTSTPNLQLVSEKEINKRDYFNPVVGQYRYNSQRTQDIIISRTFKDEQAKVTILTHSLAIETETGYDYYILNFTVTYITPVSKVKAKKEYLVNYPANYKP